MVNYTDSEIQEANEVIKRASSNWPFTRLTQDQIEKVEWATRVLNQVKNFGVESPY